MVICKFFLQGTCRFGDSCKFEHQLNDHNYGGSSSILLQNYQKPQATSNIDTNTLIKAVINDMVLAEKGGQWLLSSYAPFKEKPAFPGFEDQSMEEIRFMFYEAMRKGTGEQFKQNLRMTLQQTMMKIKALQNPAPDLVTILKNIYDTPPSSSFGVQNNQPSLFSSQNNQSPFGDTSASSIFGSPQPQKSLFGAANPSQSIFGGGNAPQQNVFNTQSTPSASIFGGQSTASSIFGAPPNVQLNSSIFGRAPTASSNSTNNTSIFGASPLFGGGAPQPQSQSLFTQQPTQPNVFAQPNQAFAQVAPQQQSAFQQSASSGIFGAQTAPQSAPSNPFGGAQAFAVTKDASPLTSLQLVPSNTSQSPFQHSQNIFGTTAPGFAASQSNANEEFYSKLEDLTEAEIKWFQSDDLDLMKIPEKPPTYEMCFKVQ